MIEFRKSVVIDRPVGEVFAFLSDSTNETQWQSGLVESRHTATATRLRRLEAGPRAGGAGTRGDAVYALGDEDRG